MWKKTFRTERVNCFCAKNMSRVHKSLLLLHTCHVYPGTHVIKLLILSGKFSDWPEIFHTVQKLSRLSGNFSHPLETFHTAENFPDCRETFQTVWYILKLIISYVDVQALFYFMVNFARRRKNLPVGNADTSTRFLRLLKPACAVSCIFCTL